MTDDSALQTFYESQVRPAIDEIEQLRRAVLQRSIVAGLGIGAAALVLGGLLAYLFSSFVPLAIAFFAGLMAWYWATSGPRERYRSEFKRRVIKGIVRLVGEDLSYEPGGQISEGEYMAAKLYLRDPDRYSGEDLISGRHGATSFRFSEVHSEYKSESTDSKGNRKTSWHTIFKGVFFIGDFNKSFNGLTVVLPDVAESTFGFIGKTLQSWGAKLDSRQGELVALEDPEFEKAFAVYATDQVEARYILSTSLMRRILEYKRKTGQNIALSFHHSNIYVAIATRKNLFEAPSIFTPIEKTLGPDQVRAYLEDLQMVFSIVDELDLNTRIWSKQEPALAS